jgi:neurabin
MSHSTSKDDNLADIGTEKDRSPSPKRKHHAPITNGIGKIDPSRIHNVSRLKSDKPEKPEKPERKFNSRELIEKQKNWTSHFSKTRTTKCGSEVTRCDIIRAVPSTILGMSPMTKDISPVETQPLPPQPPSPPKRQVRQNSFPSPTKDIPPAVPPHKVDPASLSPTKISPVKLKSPQHEPEPPPVPPPPKCIPDEAPEVMPRKSSIGPTIPPAPEDPNTRFKFNDFNAALRRQSSEKDSTGLTSPAHAISSSPSPGASASSGPSSPIHTEDEKQENEPTEKAAELKNDAVAEIEENESVVCDDDEKHDGECVLKHLFYFVGLRIFAKCGRRCKVRRNYCRYLQL